MSTLTENPNTSAIDEKAATHSGCRPWGKIAWLVVAAFLLLAIPYVLDDRYFAGLYFTEPMLLGITLPELNLALVAVIGAVALNLLVGRAGLISLGHAAFFSVGAATVALGSNQLDLPFVVTVPLAGVVGALVGVLVGLPSLRLRGLYLMLATLSLHYISLYLFQKYQFDAFGPSGIPFTMPTIFGWELSSDIRWYYVMLAVVVLVLVGLRNLDRSRSGQSFVAVRDHEVAASALGMNPARIRLAAFATSSFLVSLAGALYAYLVGLVNADSFTLTFVIGYFAMVLLGGMGSMGGAVAGALVWSLLPSVLRLVATYVDPTTPVVGRAVSEYQSQVIMIVTGLSIIAILRFRPDGLSGLWKGAVEKFTTRTERKSA